MKTYARLRNGRSIRCAALFLAAAASLSAGCDPGEPGMEGAPRVDEVDQEIRGGTVVTRSGVVYLQMPDNVCSGIMLNSATVLTSAHCVRHLLPPGAKTFETTQIDVSYKFPNGVRRNISRDPTDNQPADMIIYVYPKWNGSLSAANSANDLAVISPYVRLYGTSDSDYAFIYDDSIGYENRLQEYGYGYDAFAGTGLGVLRTGTMEIGRPLQPPPRRMFTLVNRGSRTCRGDSGGPAAIYATKTGAELHVLGLSSWMDIAESGTGNCATDSGLTYYTNLSDKLAFIQEHSPATCVRLKSPQTSRWLRRCY
jgi:hypothetical protein